MTRLTFLFAILLTGCASRNFVEDPGFYNGLNKWFSAWELVSKDIYHLDSLSPVEFVFFDDRYVYSTSAITIPEGDFIKGPSLLGHEFVWKRAEYKDSLTLPDKSRVPIGLMSFAAELTAEKAKSFFVMPLPQFWKRAGVSSKELGDENLYTGVFLHEFSHSQQMQNFGKGITALEKANDFGIEFSDDFIQHLFGKDSAYVRMFTNELDIVYKAAEDSTLIRAGLDSLQSRHNKFFIGKYENLKEIDEFFLTMEGLGQYTMYAWLTHKNGGNIPVGLAIAGVRRGKKWWSQEEGFALFLVLERLSGPGNWAKQMFGNQTQSVVNLIQSNH